MLLVLRKAASAHAITNTSEKGMESSRVPVSLELKLSLAGSAGALARTERAARRLRFIKFYLAFEKHRLPLGRARAPALPVASSPTPQIELVHKQLLIHEAGSALATYMLT